MTTMRTLNDIMDQEYENDDGEIICQLENEITERDVVICEMWKLLEQSVREPDSSFVCSEALEKYHDFIKSLGTDYEPLEEQEPPLLEDDFITCEECLCWASETSENGHNVNCPTGLKLEESK